MLYLLKDIKGKSLFAFDDDLLSAVCFWVILWAVQCFCTFGVLCLFGMLFFSLLSYTI